MLETLETRALLSFAAPVSYNIGMQPSPNYSNVSSDGVATGDFNGDGLPDLAVVHTADHTVNILLNNGDGTFQQAVSYDTGTLNPIWVTVADLTGNGILDLAVLGASNASDNPGAVSIFLGNGDGTFQQAHTYSSGPESRGVIAVGDFHGDGRLDLAVTDFNGGAQNPPAVDILRNNGDGTFQAPYAVPVPYPARAVTAGDFNGDGNTDLAVADGEGYNGMLQTSDPAGVTILLGNGDGTFRIAGQYDSPATPGGGTVNPEAITAGDLSGDGITDLIVSDYDHNINVFLGNGDGTFHQAVGYDTGEYGRAVAIADVNGDGNVDLVVGNVGNVTETPPALGSVAVLLGNGDGTFQDAIQYTPFNYPGWLAVADFNGDGLPDIAVTRVQDGHSVNVMLNEGDTLTATGTALQATTGQDFAAVVASFTDAGPNPGQAADYRTVIDWGDGSPLGTGGVAVLGGGQYEVAASHIYTAAGEYQAAVTITDNRDPSRTAAAVTTIDVTDLGEPGGAGRHQGTFRQEVAAALPAAPTVALRSVPSAAANLPEPTMEHRMTPAPWPAPTQEAWASVDGCLIAEPRGLVPPGHADLLDVLALSLLV